MRLQEVGAEEHVVSGVDLPLDPGCRGGLLAKAAAKVADIKPGIADGFSADDDFVKGGDPPVDLARTHASGLSLGENLAGVAGHAHAGGRGGVDHRGAGAAVDQGPK